MAKNKLAKSKNPVQIIRERTDLKGREAHTLLHELQRSFEITTRSGPYPTPEEYEYYHEIDPALTEQMKSMVKAEQDHQMQLNAQEQQNDFALKKRGQNIAALLYVVTAFLAGYGFYLGLGWVAGVVSALPIAHIVATYLKS